MGLTVLLLLWPRHKAEPLKLVKKIEPLLSGSQEAIVLIEKYHY